MESNKETQFAGQPLVTSLSPRSDPAPGKYPRVYFELSQGIHLDYTTYGTSRCFPYARWSPYLPHTD